MLLCEDVVSVPHFAKSLLLTHGSNTYDFYYRWTMTIYYKSLNKGEPGVSDGMSQIWYTDDGLIGLHRDFWDAASGIFEYLPVFRSAIPWVKRKL